MINLRPPFEKLVQEKVQTGEYDTADQVVETALTLLAGCHQQPIEFTPEHETHIRRCLAEAEDDIRSGRVIEVDQEGLRALCDEVKRRGQEQLTAKAPRP